MNKRILNIYIEKQWYMKCTHLYLNIVRFHLKMLEKKIIKDFNVKLIWQLSENGRVPLNILNHGQTRMHSFFTAKRTLFTMKCTHLYLKRVRIPLKILDKKFIKDFNLKLIWQLSENGRIPLNILNHGQTRMHSFFTAKRTLFTMKCTHLYLKRVRIPLKILDKKFIKDFNINLIGNYQKMVELLWISLITAKRPNGQTTNFVT